jgi:hypothetical protein
VIGDYLISKGIAPGRIITSGSGNTLGLATVPLQNPGKDICIGKQVLFPKNNIHPTNLLREND